MKIQRRIAEGGIDTETWLCSLQRRRWKEFEIKGDGAIPEGLPGFFEADFEELLAQVRARRAAG